MKKNMIIGSRGSILALAQSETMKEKLIEKFPELEVEIKVIVTSGDTDQKSNWNNSDESLKSFFTKEIEEELLDGKIDIAVHSMKDMPMVSPEGLICGAVPDREDNRDALITISGRSISELPSGSRIGTSSLRRTMGLKCLRPDLVIEQLRGNIHTRLRKLDEGLYDGIILASAGLIRVGLANRITQILEIDEIMPAPAQGALYIQCRENDSEVREILSTINNSEVEETVKIEREFSRIFDGGCHTPMGCSGKLFGDRIILKGNYFHEGTLFEDEIEGYLTEGIELAVKLSEKIKKQIANFSKGKVYMIGAGCGNVDLLTLKGKRIIEEVDCIIYDRLIDSRILNFAKEDAELIYLGKGNTEGGVIQEEINRTIIEKAMEGKNVARVKGGDSFVFGRGGEELEALNSHGIEYEMVPGISSSIAVPEYAGIPVTHRGVADSFHVFTGHTKENGKWHNFEVIAKLEGTLIFLMGIKNLEIIVKDLIDNGKSMTTPIAIIEKGTTADQRVTVGTLENIVELSEKKEIEPPAIIIIGEVVKFADKFSWVKKMPLFGKKILVTRNQDQMSELSDNIRKLGGETIECPLLDIVASDNELTENLEEYSALLFNSPNGVKFFMEKLDDIRKLGQMKIGVVGAKTREVLESYKITPDFMPKEYTMEKLVEDVTFFTKKEEKILVISSDISPGDEEKWTEQHNREFVKFIAYHTKKKAVPKEEIVEIIEKVEYLTFLSSSTVGSFYEAIEGKTNLVKNKKMVSIGPVTSETMRELGFEVALEAEKYDTQGIIDIIKGDK